VTCSAAPGPFTSRVTGNESDLQLLHRITAGDREALRELYEGYYHSVLRFMRRVTGQSDLAQEGVNDVMLVVWRNSKSFTGRSKVSTWIMGIAYHKALKLLEASRRWSRHVDVADVDEWIEHGDVAAVSSAHGDLRDLLDAALRRLSLEQRTVVELTYFGGCSYQEIATIMGCPVNTVKTRMFHARGRLRQLLPMLDTTFQSVPHEED
jgi:RNA polymerase sigma-70 factor (ECF subfamily)